HLMSANWAQHSRATFKPSASRGSDGMGSASMTWSQSDSSSMPARIDQACRWNASATAGSYARPRRRRRMASPSSRPPTRVASAIGVLVTVGIAANKSGQRDVVDVGALLLIESHLARNTKRQMARSQSLAFWLSHADIRANRQRRDKLGQPHRGVQWFQPHDSCSVGALNVLSIGLRAMQYLQWLRH